MLSFATQVLIRERAQMVSDHGATSPDWSLPTSDLTIPGWSVQPGASDEDRANRDGVLIQWTAYGPAGADVLPGDHVRFNGVSYDVDGEPARWQSPTGSISNTVLFLKRWEG